MELETRTADKAAETMVQAQHGAGTGNGGKGRSAGRWVPALPLTTTVPQMKDFCPEHMKNGTKSEPLKFKDPMQK